MPHHVGLFLRPRLITLFGFHETLQHPSTEPPFFVLAPAEFMALASIGPSHIDKVRNSNLGTRDEQTLALTKGKREKDKRQSPSHNVRQRVVLVWRTRRPG